MAPVKPERSHSRSATTDFSLPPIEEDPGKRRKPPQSSSRLSASLPVSSFDSGTPVDLQTPRTAIYVWLALGLRCRPRRAISCMVVFPRCDTLGGAMMFSIAMLAGSIFPLFQTKFQRNLDGETQPQSCQPATHQRCSRGLSWAFNRLCLPAADHWR